MVIQGQVPVPIIKNTVEVLQVQITRVVGASVVPQRKVGTVQVDRHNAGGELVEVSKEDRRKDDNKRRQCAEQFVNMMQLHVNTSKNSTIIKDL